MPRITISYRRDDSGVITGRIFDRLATHYGRDAVFRDIDSIPPGADFREHISHVLDESDMLLAIVGPKWLGTRGAQTRLDDESDPVRVEIETGLRKKMPVIPVLVLRAAMPRVAQLPDSVKDFAYRHAVHVDAGQDFDVHAARLIRAMDRILRDKAGGVPVREPDLPGEAILGPEEDLIVLPPALIRTEAAAPLAPPLDIAPMPAVEPRAPPRERRRSAGIVIGLTAGALLGAVAATVATLSLRPGVPPDIAALATAKQAADGRALSLQAELAGTQKRLATAQDALAAAQKQAADQGTRLSDLQASADQTAKELAAQKDIAGKAQTQIAGLTDQAKALGDQQARADKAESDLAVEKKAAAQAQGQRDQAEKDLAAQKDVAAKAQTEADRLSTQLAAEKKAHQDALDRIAQLTAQPASAPSEAAAQPVTAPPGETGDSAWTVDQRRDAQIDLKAIGHLQGNADGNFGAATRTAITQFQSFAGDPETGVMTDAERAQLHGLAQRLAVLLSRADTSPDGVAASVVKGAAARYARGWEAQAGSNGAPDPAEAVYWYGLAAADGDSQAYTNLGLLLARGQGVAKPDPAGAAVLWWAAAARGGATAMFNLGAIWEHGIGVAADPAKAKTWYQRAAAKGDASAVAAVKRMGG
jgi:TPR repeat protein